MKMPFPVAAALMLAGCCLAFTAVLAWTNATGRTHDSWFVVAAPAALVLLAVVVLAIEFFREVRRLAESGR